MQDAAVHKRNKKIKLGQMSTLVQTNDVGKRESMWSVFVFSFRWMSSVLELGPGRAQAQARVHSAASGSGFY
jgi:hypothetical protein